MDLNANQVESIVRQVLTQMGGASAPKKAAGIPATARVAMLTGPKTIEVNSPCPRWATTTFWSR